MTKSSTKRILSLEKSLDRPPKGHTTIHWAKMSVDGLAKSGKGQPVSVTLVHYYETRVITWPDVELDSSLAWQSSVLLETPEFRATAVVDLESHFQSSPFSKHASIDCSLRTSLDAIYEKYRNSTHRPVFVVIEQSHPIPTVSFSSSQALLLTDHKMLEGGKPGDQSFCVFLTSDTPAPAKPSDTVLINRVLAAVKAQRLSAYHLDTLVNVPCYVTDDGRSCYTVQTNIDIRYGGARVVSKMTPEEFQKSCQDMCSLIKGFSDEERSIELRELLASFQLEGNQDDKYFKLWYLRIVEAAKDFARSLGLAQYKDDPEIVAQIQYRNALAHPETDEVDFNFITGIQKIVGRVLKERYLN